MIKPGGFNVSTLEVEIFLKSHPAICEAAVVGVPDERLGETGYAFLELNQGARVTGPELVLFCRDQIAAYKIPTYFQFVTEWPFTASQKIKKMELKSLAIRGLNNKI